MPVGVMVPSLLRSLVGGAKSVSAQGHTIGEILEDLNVRYPGFKEHIVEQDGSLKQFVNIFINDEDVRFMKALATPVRDGDMVAILPAVAGG